ncbi:MAG: TIGR00159 family protein [Planctomycetes bacterium]|nr:TIGR00159 family protein [Planctomycetota bacterium]
MDLLTRLNDLLRRLDSYPAPVVLIELAVIWGTVYLVLRFVRDTRAAGALKGILLIVLLLSVGGWILGGAETFQRLAYLIDRFLGILALALVVIFQPELRRAAIRVGESTFFFRSTPSEIAQVVEAISDSCRYLSKSRFGAIIVIERSIGLTGLTEGGTRIDAVVSARLIQSIFFPGTALHDLAVLIRGRVVHAAGVQLPMADPLDMADRSLGARHRAAVGITRECDALVVVVAEETGLIRIAERGRLSDPIGPDELADRLRQRLRREPPVEGDATAAEELQDPEATIP